MVDTKKQKETRAQANEEPPKDMLLNKPSQPFCRICHETASESKLLSPCMCLGTMRNVHRKCLEHWLTTSQSSECELCCFVYAVKPKYPGIFEWLKRNPRPLIIDLVLTLFLTPLAMFSVVLCYRGAILQVEVRNTVESLSLFALGSFLTGVYLSWVALTVRSQFKTFRSWRRSHPRMSLVHPNSPISIIVPYRNRKPRRDGWMVDQSSPIRTYGINIDDFPRVISVGSLGTLPELPEDAEHERSTPRSSSPVDSMILREEIAEANRARRNMNMFP